MSGAAQEQSPTGPHEQGSPQRLAYEQAKQQPLEVLARILEEFVLPEPFDPGFNPQKKIAIEWGATRHTSITTWLKIVKRQNTIWLIAMPNLVLERERRIWSIVLDREGSPQPRWSEGQEPSTLDNNRCPAYAPEPERVQEMHSHVLSALQASGYFADEGFSAYDPGRSRVEVRIPHSDYL